MSVNVSDLASVHPEAQIGEGVVIEPFARIEKNVVIGDHTFIGPNVVIYEGARIGFNCKIFSGAVLSAIPQDLKYKGEETTVEIGDHTIIREFVTVNKGTSSRGYTRIGKRCVLMNYAHVAHDSVVGDDSYICNNVQIGGEVVIENNVHVGGSSVIHQFCKIGAHTWILGMSGVLADVPPYLVAAGFPVAYHDVNLEGMRTHDITEDKIKNVVAIYDAVYHKGLNTSQAVEFLEGNFHVSEERESIVRFIRDSTRGIVKKIGSKNNNKMSNEQP
jgi:UDP-N-acetylglucosamine acyltransferase